MTKASRKPRRTEKLRQASRVLAAECFCDTDDQAVLRAVLAGKITTDQAYQALHHFGYRWHVGARFWELKYPAWMIDFWRVEKGND